MVSVASVSIPSQANPGAPGGAADIGPSARGIDCDPADVAAAAVFLVFPAGGVSPAGGYITGKVIEVDGGIDRPNLDLGLPDP